jgi:ribosomal protein L29
MKTKERQTIKGKEQKELQTMLKDARARLFQARLDQTQFKLKNTRSLFSIRKEIAVILTALQEKEESLEARS